MRLFLAVLVLFILSGCSVYRIDMSKNFDVRVDLRDCEDVRISPDFAGLAGGSSLQELEALQETSIDPKAVGDGAGSAIGTTLKGLIKQ